MKIPDLTRKFTKTFKNVFKNLKKTHKIKRLKEEPLLSVLPCRQNPWQKMCQILEGNDL